MNIQARLPISADEFLRWNEGRDGKWDFVGGRIVDMMVRVSRNHAAICGNLFFSLRSKLASPPYLVSSADFGVRTANSVRYPDVMVDSGAGKGTDLDAAAPVLIAEVLSPSTMSTDFGAKQAEYQTIPALGHYLVLAQDEPRVWLWSRDDDGAWQDAVMIEGETASIDLPALGLTLDLAELYQGLELRRP